jgi:hypothetical protein
MSKCWILQKLLLGQTDFKVVSGKKGKFPRVYFKLQMVR